MSCWLVSKRIIIFQNTTDSRVSDRMKLILCLPLINIIYKQECVKKGKGSEQRHSDVRLSRWQANCHIGSVLWQARVTWHVEIHYHGNMCSHNQAYVIGICLDTEKEIYILMITFASRFATLCDQSSINHSLSAVSQLNLGRHKK